MTESRQISDRLQRWRSDKLAASRAFADHMRKENGPISIYATDDYPREGCSLSVDVCPTEYLLRVLSPTAQPIELYHCRTAHGLSLMIQDWCEGHMPRPPHWADQPDSTL